MMTPPEIRAVYEAVIGAAACDKLAAAGLLPTVEERQWRLDQEHRVTTETRDSMTYIRQARYCTGWTDMPD